MGVGGRINRLIKENLFIIFCSFEMIAFIEDLHFKFLKKRKHLETKPKPTLKTENNQNSNPSGFGESNFN